MLPTYISQEGRDVYLIFSVQGSGHFQGVAKMTSPSGSERAREFGSGYAFGVEWIKRLVSLKENSPVKHLCTSIIVLYNLYNIPKF